MLKIIASSALAVALASSVALAQTTPPPAATAPSATTMDPAAEAKFKAADKDNSGALEGAELSAYKADMTKIDTDKDGKVSRSEFAAGVKSGVIK